jgi:hypothetical protein
VIIIKEGKTFISPVTGRDWKGEYNSDGFREFEQKRISIAGGKGHRDASQRPANTV